MELGEINPVYVHPTGDGEEAESSYDERRPRESALERLWRSFDGRVMVSWFDRDVQNFSFWFLLTTKMGRLPVSGGLSVGVFRGACKTVEIMPILHWDMIWAEGSVCYVRAKYTDKLVQTFSGPSLENLKVVIERTDRKPRQKVACRVISAGHAPPF